MAANIASLTNISCQSNGLTLTGTSETQVLSNAAGSGQILRVVSLRAANTAASAATIAALRHTAAALGGTAHKLCPSISVPVGAALDIITKDTPLYLPEGTSLGVIAGAANALDVTVNYEVMS